EKVREDIIQKIESMPRDQFGDEEYESTSISDDITQWQIAQGLHPKEQDRTGLSIGRKLKLYNDEVEFRNASGRTYPKDAWQDAEGQWWQKGRFGEPVKAEPNMQTIDEWEEGEKQKERYNGNAGKLWNFYRAAYPGCNPEAVYAAAQQLV